MRLRTRLRTPLKISFSNKLWEYEYIWGTWVEHGGTWREHEGNMNGTRLGHEVIMNETWREQDWVVSFTLRAHNVLIMLLSGHICSPVKLCWRGCVVIVFVLISMLTSLVSLLTSLLTCCFVVGDAIVVRWRCCWRRRRRCCWRHRSLALLTLLLTSSLTSSFIDVVVRWRRCTAAQPFLLPKVFFSETSS